MPEARPSKILKDFQHILYLVLLLVPGMAVASDAKLVLDDYDALKGFVDLYWDEQQGRILMRAEAFDEPFLHQASLARGVGSNDIGLDRGQLGVTRIVRFIRSGPKVLLMEDNLQYRASSDNEDERRAVKESFARSVWQAHYRFARAEISRLRDQPQLINDVPGPAVPPGSPIGSARD
jgi:hypothetical protein